MHLLTQLDIHSVVVCVCRSYLGKFVCVHEFLCFGIFCICGTLSLQDGACDKQSHIHAPLLSSLWLQRFPSDKCLSSLDSKTFHLSHITALMLPLQHSRFCLILAIYFVFYDAYYNNLSVPHLSCQL